MKHLFYLSISIFLCAILSSCSKKNISVSNNEQNKIYSQQLEMDYEATPSEPILSASANDSYSFSSPVVDERFELAANSSAKSKELKANQSMIAQIKAASTKAEKIAILRENLSEKIGVKKMDKIADKLNATVEGSVNGAQIITGIILGVIGIVLLGIAGMTGAPGLVYTAGIVLFVAAVILILIGVF